VWRIQTDAMGGLDRATDRALAKIAEALARDGSYEPKTRNGFSIGVVLLREWKHAKRFGMIECFALPLKVLIELVPFFEPDDAVDIFLGVVAVSIDQLRDVAALICRDRVRRRFGLAVSAT
jgi:hypothetical protein